MRYGMAFCPLLSLGGPMNARGTTPWQGGEGGGREGGREGGRAGTGEGEEEEEEVKEGEGHRLQVLRRRGL